MSELIPQREAAKMIGIRLQNLSQSRYKGSKMKKVFIGRVTIMSSTICSLKMSSNVSMLPKYLYP